METTEIVNKLTEMGYCVENIFSYYPLEGADTSGLPDSALMVEMCDGKILSFTVFGDKIKETPEFKDGDEFPF